MNALQTKLYVLLVDENIYGAEAFKEVIQQLPDYSIKLTHVSSLASGFESMDTIVYNIIFLSSQLMSSKRQSVLSQFAQKNPNIPIVIITELAETFADNELFRGGAQDYIDRNEIFSKMLSRVIRQSIARKRIEIELNRERENALKLAEVKSQFLANMSHEIRTPLSAILGYTELLYEQNLARSERASLIEVVRRNGNHLSQIINEILDLTKIEAGRLELETSNFDLGEVLNEILLLFEPTAKQKGLTLKLVTQGLVPETIKTDRTRLRQILINLIGNAVKFSQSGEIEVQVKTTIDNQKNIIAFMIKDCGPGICEDQKKCLFEAFRQADNSINRKYGGTGLGLALARNLSRALGGDVILVSSEPSKGALFMATLDAGDLNGAKMIASFPTPKYNPQLSFNTLHAISLKDVHVLVVDDTSDSRELVRKFLEKAGAYVECASNGDEGINMALMNSPDVILMDIQMPVVDGYTATAQLRAKGYTKPIIAFTAHAMKEEKEKCLSSGCDGYISKPVSRQNLIEVIAEKVGVKYMEALLPKSQQSQVSARGLFMYKSPFN